jgi:glucose/arabinose dehydrogenase
VVLAAAVLGAWAGAARADETAAGHLRFVPVPDAATQFSDPVNVTGPPADASRLFVAERAGRIMLVKDGGAPTTFLDIRPAVNSTPSSPGNPSENGFSSVAFDPDYGTNGRFFVFYTSNAVADCNATNTNLCDDKLVEFHRSDSDHDVADPVAVRTLLTIPHRDSAIHHAGQLQFGPDGLLYVSTGDGGKPADGNQRAQDAGSLSGKILRLNVDDASPTPVIWALGLRNPYRFSFDAVKGDLVLGDVGETNAEEIDWRPQGTAPGSNFGWSNCEGDLAFLAGVGGSSDPCPPNPVSNYVPPSLTYPHPTGSDCGAAVVGGYVVRDPMVPDLLGRYLYADFCHGWIRSVTLPAAADDRDTCLALTVPTSIGQDAAGRIYVTSLVGSVYRLEQASDSAGPSCSPPPPPPPDATGAGLIPPAALATPPPPAETGRRPPAPVISRVSLTRRRFAVGSRATAIRARAPRGTVFVFRLSEPATVSIDIARLLSGRRGAGGRCLAPSRRRHGRRCTRLQARGRLSRAAAAGSDRTAFSGRLGSRPLAPGRYRATLRARNATGSASAPRATDFEILPG